MNLVRDPSADAVKTLVNTNRCCGVATFESREQEITGSNPTVTTDPERGALRILLGLCNPFRST